MKQSACWWRRHGSTIAACRQRSAPTLGCNQTDSIRWEVTADGGTNWQDVLPDGDWDQLTFTGTDFRWRSTHVLVDLTTNPNCTDLEISWLFEFSLIDSILDIPNDQGRQFLGRGVDTILLEVPLRLSNMRSFEESIPISQYLPISF